MLAFADWLTLENKKDVQQFLSFTNFYRRFIWDFSDDTWPLFDLTGKSRLWVWIENNATAFQSIKDAVTTKPVLILPDEFQLYQLEADSSNFASGAVLSQEGPNEKWHPVAFYSKSLSLGLEHYD